MTSMFRFATLVSLLATLIPAQATTVTRASLDDLIQKSTSIVRGRVTAAMSGSRGPSIYTVYKIQVLDRWKGAVEQQVDVQVAGGSVGALRQEIAGAPQLALGSEYVFFLWTGPSRTNYLLGLSQGVFDVAKDAAGNLVLTRQSSDAVAIDPATGAAGALDSVQMKMSDFGARVARTLKGADITK